MPKKILTSIHGRKLGLDHDGRLVAPGGIVNGEGLYQSILPGGPSVVLFDDFTNGFQNGATQPWLAIEGTDSATSDAAIVSGADGIGGVLRLTTGDAGTGYAADAEQVTQRALMWKAANGNLNLEARVKLSAITTCYAFVGFTDTVAAALEAPIVSAASGNTLTTNATDAVGFMFDTNMTDDNWWLTGVANNVDATAQNSGYAPVAGAWVVLRVELDTSGNATFYRNGLQVGTRMANAVTPTVPLTAVMTVSKLSVAASMTMDIDYIQVAMNR